MVENGSRDTWVLVYDGITKTVVNIIEPGFHTQAGGTNILKEFSTKAELDAFVKDNNLIVPDSL